MSYRSPYARGPVISFPPIEDIEVQTICQQKLDNRPKVLYDLPMDTLNATPTPLCPVIWGKGTTWTDAARSISWCAACARYFVTVQWTDDDGAIRTRRVFISAAFAWHAFNRAGGSIVKVLSVV